MPHPVRVVKGIFAESEGVRPMQVVEKPALSILAQALGLNNLPATPVPPGTGIVARATEKPRAVTVLDCLVERWLENAAKAGAEAAQSAAQKRIDQIEINNSQKAMTERLRDRNWSW